MTLGLTEAAEKIHTPRSLDQLCFLQKARRSLPADEFAELKAFVLGSYPGRIVVKVLKDKGFEVSTEFVIRKHRHGECVSCQQAD